MTEYCTLYASTIKQTSGNNLLSLLFISKVLLKYWMLIQSKFESTYLCCIYDDRWISNENNIWTILLFFRDSTAFNAGLVDNDQTVYDVSMNRTLYMGVVSVSRVVANTAGRVIAIHNGVTVMWCGGTNFISSQDAKQWSGALCSALRPACNPEKQSQSFAALLLRHSLSAALVHGMSVDKIKWIKENEWVVC